MQNNKRYGLIAAFIIFCLALAVAGAFHAFRQMDNNRFPRKMFEDFSQFEVEYDEYLAIDKSNDKDIGNLVPLSSWCADVEFKAENYKIFAYEFANAEDAFAYYQNVSGQKDAARQLCLFFQGSSMGKTKYVAYFSERAYKVEGGRPDDFSEFMTHLCSDFSIDIIEQFHNEYGIWLE